MAAIGAVALSACGPSETHDDIDRLMKQARTATEQGDYATALSLWRPLATQGNAEAQVLVGDSYWGREGVAQDRVEALRWYHMAADQGDMVAQYYLGYIYRNGDRRIPQSPVDAVLWYRLAAEQGQMLAQCDLGEMYAQGEGVSENLILAYKWFTLAAAQGDEKAADLRNLVTDRMTASQIDEGQRLAAEWKPKQ